MTLTATNFRLRMRAVPTEIPQSSERVRQKYETDGVLIILSEFDAGLTDSEGFSHLYIVWVLTALRDSYC